MTNEKGDNELRERITKLGIDFEQVQRTLPDLVERIRMGDSGSCLAGKTTRISSVVFDERFGVGAILSDHDWYNFSGADRSAKVVTVFSPDGTKEDYQYHYYMYGARFRDEECIRDLRLNSSSTENELVLDADTAAGERILRYCISSRKN